MAACLAFNKHLYTKAVTQRNNGNCGFVAHKALGCTFCCRPQLRAPRFLAVVVFAVVFNIPEVAAGQQAREQG